VTFTQQLRAARSTLWEVQRLSLPATSIARRALPYVGAMLVIVLLLAFMPGRSLWLLPR